MPMGIKCLFNDHLVELFLRVGIPVKKIQYKELEKSI